MHLRALLSVLCASLLFCVAFTNEVSKRSTEVDCDPSKFEPVVDCVEFMSTGFLRAWFGYSYYGDECTFQNGQNFWYNVKEVQSFPLLETATRRYEGWVIFDKTASISWEVLGNDVVPTAKNTALCSETATFKVKGESITGVAVTRVAAAVAEVLEIEESRVTSKLSEQTGMDVTLDITIGQGADEDSSPALAMFTLCTTIMDTDDVARQTFFQNTGVDILSCVIAEQSLSPFKDQNGKDKEFLPMWAYYAMAGAGGLILLIILLIIIICCCKKCKREKDEEIAMKNYKRPWELEAERNSKPTKNGYTDLSAQQDSLNDNDPVPLASPRANSPFNPAFDADDGRSLPPDP